MRVRQNEPMRNYTTWQIGGPAELFLEPESVEELERALRALCARGVEVHVVGGGSNLLVSDAGIAGAVIHLGGSLCGLEIKEDTVVAEAGVPLPFLAAKAAEAGLSGLEFAAGIPGTVGGAVVMNAGAYQSQMSDVVRSVRCCARDGTALRWLPAEACGFRYRGSRFRREDAPVVAAAEFALRAGDKKEILARMQANSAARRAKQPLGLPSAGSVFQNPPGDAAGRLIEAAGAKGWREGGAAVSEKHANFIVNLGGATCGDVLRLIRRIKEAVLAQSGVLLEEEIRFLGREKF